MTIKFKNIRVGMTLYDIKKNNGYGDYKWKVWPVKIISIDTVKSTVVASWNGNAPKTMSESTVTHFRVKSPEHQKK